MHPSVPIAGCRQAPSLLLHAASLMLALALTGCAPQAPPAANAPAAASVPVRDPGCEALASPLRALSRLGSWSPAPGPEAELLHPALLAETLDAEAATARGVVAADAELAGLATGMAALFTETARGARAMAATEAEAYGGHGHARLESMTMGAIEDAKNLGKVADRRCAPAKAAPAPGRLDASVIQKVVRASFGAFRLCYENGLRRDANLTGKVTVRFVIGRDGHVSNVDWARTPDPFAWGPRPVEAIMPDHQVAACIVESFKAIVFPPPEGGIVPVAYLIMFSPGAPAR